MRWGGVMLVVVTLYLGTIHPPDTIAGVIMGCISIVVGVNSATRSQSEEVWM